MELAAAKKPATGMLAGKLAAVESAAATVAVSAVAPTAAKGERPVLANGPVAASKECWVINPGIGPKVIEGSLMDRRRQRLPPQERGKPEGLCQGRDGSGD